MTDNKIKIIADNNKVIILKFIKLLCDWFNLTEEKIKNMPKENLKFHIRNALTRVRVDEYKLHQLRLEIEEKGRIIEEFERAYVSGDAYDAIGEGKNTGGHPNNVEIRQIKKIRLKEEQQQRIIEYDEAEKRVKEKHQDIRNFIELLPQAHFIKIMDMTYFRDMSMGQISKQVNYDSDYIKIIRTRALTELFGLVRSVFKKNKNDNF